MDVIDYIDRSTYVILFRVYTESDTIQIPEQIDGKPVRELADHAFADEPSVLYAESEKRRAVRSGHFGTFQSTGAGASAASTHSSSERTERPDASVNAVVQNNQLVGDVCRPVTGRPDASVNAAVQNSERLSTLPPSLCGRRLRAVILPDALAAIGNYAFYGCDNLKTVSFPASIRLPPPAAAAGKHLLCSTCYTCTAAGGSADSESRSGGPASGFLRSGRGASSLS